MPRCHAATILLAAARAVAAAGGVVKLGDSTYDGFVADNAAFLIAFTAPWCGHSRALMPEYEKLSGSLAADGLPVAHVDGTEHEALATRLDVKGYPTIFFVRGDATLEYDGERRSQDIKSWALRKLRPEVATLATNEELGSFVKGKPAALVLFVGGAVDTQSPIYRAFLAVAAAIEQPCAVSTASGGVELRMYSTDASSPAVLSGAEPLTRARMQKFAEVESLPLLVEYSTQVEDAVFASTVGLHVLVFFSGDKPAVDGVKAAAKALRGEAVFSLIDAPKHGEVSEFFDVRPKGSLAAPVALAFVLDTSTKYAHTAGLDEAALVAFVRSVQSGAATPHLRSQPAPEPAGPVRELVGSTYAAAVADASKDVLVQMYSPDCGHCRKLAPVYEAVARKFADDADMLVAQIDATKNDIAGMEPEGFPTILFFPKSNKKGVEYDGSRDEHDLVQFVADVREGKQHIGGLPEFEQGEEGAKVEL